MKQGAVKPSFLLKLIRLGICTLFAHSALGALADETVPSPATYETREFDLRTLYYEQSPFGRNQESIPLSQLYTSWAGNIAGFSNSSACEIVRTALQRMAPGNLDENGVSLKINPGPCKDKRQPLKNIISTLNGRSKWGIEPSVILAAPVGLQVKSVKLHSVPFAKADVKVNMEDCTRTVLFFTQQMKVGPDFIKQHQNKRHKRDKRYTQAVNFLGSCEMMLGEGDHPSSYVEMKITAYLN